MTDKYEKVTDMTVGQVVDAMLEGEDFYTLNTCDSYGMLDCEVDEIKDAVEDRSLYRKFEAPWWEKHIGNVVMVRGDERDSWGYDRLIQVLKNGWFVCDKGTWDYARPLTAAEKDAIITEG